MPLTKLQFLILGLLAAGRDPESYVAGSTYLNRASARFSNDIDIFHDLEERVAQAALKDAAILEQAGLTVTWNRRQPTFYQALIALDAEVTKLEWVVDSDYRFFPAQRDPVFGFVLHLADLATNKAMAAAGRREPRDIIDLVLIDREILPLGAVIWAAVGKALGFTPEGLINEIRRLARYTEADFRRVHCEPPADPATIMTQLRDALERAEEFVHAMPSERAGMLFLQNGIPVQPDPANLAAYTTHAGCRRGHWPSSPEIMSEMIRAQAPHA